MSKATQPQLELVAALGKFEGRDLSKAQASSLINEAKAEGIAVDWEKKDKQYLKILQILKRRLTASIKKETDIEQKKELEEELSFLCEEIEEWKDYLKEDADDKREEAKQDKENARYRIDNFHEEIQDYKGYSRLTKKPTKGEIRTIVEAMDKEKPDWEDDKRAESNLIDNLLLNYKHLGNKKPRPSASRPSGGKKKKESTSCFTWLFLIVIIVIIYNMF